MNPNIAEEYVKQIMDDFGLKYEYPKIIYDNSLHYKCYLDDGYEQSEYKCILDKQKKSHTIYK